MLRVDAHVHFWDPAAISFDWLPNVKPLCRAFLPQDRQGDLFRADAWVVVEAGARDPLSETRWLAALLQHEARPAAIVAGIPLLDEIERPHLLAVYRDMPIVSGVRSTLANQPTDVLRGDSLRAALLDIENAGFSFDLNVASTQLADISKLARDLPTLDFVLNHGGNPIIAPSAFKEWADDLADLADCPNIVCKLSGLITRETSLCPSALRPWVRHIIDCFGPKRVMIGSDFPVVTLAEARAEWFTFLEDELSAYSSKAQAALWGETACRFYGLPIAEEGDL